jgi:hypothetical protein
MDRAIRVYSIVNDEYDVVEGRTGLFDMSLLVTELNVDGGNGGEQRCQHVN